MKKLISMLLALAMVLGLCACGGQKGSESLSQESKEVSTATAPEVGYFTFESMEMDGETITKDDLKNVGGDPDSMFLILNEDGTGTMVTAGEDAEQIGRAHF